MIPAPGVRLSELDSVEVIGDDLSVFMLLSDGSLVAICLPIAELLRRGHTLVPAAPASGALRVVQ